MTVPRFLLSVVSFGSHQLLLLESAATSARSKLFLLLSNYAFAPKFISFFFEHAPKKKEISFDFKVILIIFFKVPFA